MISYLRRLINKFANAFSGIAYGLKHDRSIGFQCLIGAAVLLFGGLCLVLGFFRNRLNAWGARKQSLQVENLTMKFSDEGLAQSSSKAAASVPYHAFERLYHYRDRYFLFVDKLHAYILPEDRFVVGDSADFRAFIEAKTGKTVEYI